MTPSRTHPNPTLRSGVVAPTTQPFHSTRGAVPAKSTAVPSRRAAYASSAAARLIPVGSAAAASLGAPS